MAAHSSILPCEIPWTVEPSGATAHGVTKVRHDLVIKQKQLTTTVSIGGNSILQSVCRIYILLTLKMHSSTQCLHAKLLQPCLALCDPMDCNASGSSVRGFSRQEYWSGLPCLPPGDLPDPGIEPESLISTAMAGGFFTTSAGWETPTIH